MTRARRTFVQRWASVSAIAVVLGLGAGAPAARADAAVALATRPITGVTFEVLASATTVTPPDQAGGLALSRMTFDCGQESGRTEGIGQLFFVEWGRVEVRDWATDEVVAELETGGAYSGDGRAVYLFADHGKRASVLTFRLGGPEPNAAETPAYKELSYSSTECQSGSGATRRAEPGATVALVEDPMGTASVGDLTLFVGIVTLQPGATVGEQPARMAAGGPLVALPLIGSFGDGQILPGIVPTGFGPGEPTVLAGSGGAPVDLVNESPFPVTAMLVGAVPAGTPIVGELT